MRFGLFGSAQARRGVGVAESAAGYWEYVETAVEAEALGYHSTFLVEHHFGGAGQVAASLNLLTWIASRTKTLRIGTAVIVLPWHDPVMLAEEAATVDLMSGGRLDFGVGKGYRHTEFTGFCMDAAEAEPRFDEALALIVKSWTSDERFSHKGRFWQYDDIIVEPPTAQRPHPPIWIAAGSPDSIRKVGRLGANLILDQFASPEEIAQRIAIYKEALGEYGHAYDPMRVAVARNFAVAMSDADEESARQRAAAVHARNIKLSARPDGANKSHIMAYADRPGATEENALIGPPERIARQVEALVKAGVGYVLLNGNADARRSIRPFAEHVMPLFR